jgi:hypothetical protein
MHARTLGASLLLTASAAFAQPTASTPYTLYVSSESGDVVSRIEVGPDGWRKVREISVKPSPVS